MNQTSSETIYEPTWTSLRRHHPPLWLQEAKFGIYCHWGIWTIRYQEGNEALTFDEQIERFKGERFDPAAWAELFQAAGARFAGPVAWHGSPFVNWDSELTEYNAMDRGPRRDIVGELEKEIRQRGMKFIVSYHTTFDDRWIEFAKEGIDKYHPDLFWVDASFGGTKEAHHDLHEVLRDGKYVGGQPEFELNTLPERHQREFLAYFYNEASARGAEVELIYKSHDIPPGIGMRDLENGFLDHMPYDAWMTDLDIYKVPDWETHGWFYRRGVPLRTAGELIHILVDVVSKNGILLLNVGPRADGTFPEEATNALEGVGAWLKVNGEAIYGASPWYIFGEGPTAVPEGHHSDHFGELAFTADDIRYTVNGEHLYAITLGRPQNTVSIESLNSTFRVKPGTIESVSLLGSSQPVSWDHTPKALEIHVPGERPCEHALVFKIKIR